VVRPHKQTESQRKFYSPRLYRYHSCTHRIKERYKSPHGGGRDVVFGSGKPPRLAPCSHQLHPQPTTLNLVPLPLSSGLRWYEFFVIRPMVRGDLGQTVLGFLRSTSLPGGQSSKSSSIEYTSSLPAYRHLTLPSAFFKEDIGHCYTEAPERTPSCWSCPRLPSSQPQYFTAPTTLLRRQSLPLGSHSAHYSPRP
jgi:hypothetical protein